MKRVAKHYYYPGINITNTFSTYYGTPNRLMIKTIQSFLFLPKGKATE